MRFVKLGLIAASLTLLAACSEPDTIPYARGSYKTMPGADWVASLYETPYMKGGKSFDFHLLFDAADGEYPRPGDRNYSQFGIDLYQEHLAIGWFLCDDIGRTLASMESESRPYPFYDYFYDCD